MPKAATEPESPTTPSCGSSSDRASFGSPGAFSRTTSSDTSHSSESSVEDAVTNPGGDVTPLPPASARAAKPVTPGPVKVPSAGESSLAPGLKPSAETSHSHIPRPVPMPRPETALDRLPEPLPGYTKALREDVAVEVALFGTEVQAHILRVEGKVDLVQSTINQQLVNVQPRTQVADSGAAVAQHVVTPVGTADQEVLKALMDQYVEKSTKATQDCLTKFEKEMSGRFTKFTEEIGGKFAQLEKDVASQIRAELGSEKEKYQSTIGLYELIGELDDGPFSGDTGEPSDVDRKERLSELFEQIGVTVTSPRTGSSVELDVPSSFELGGPSALELGGPSALEPGAPPSPGAATSLAASGSSAALAAPIAPSPTSAVGPNPSPSFLIQLLLQVIRVTAPYIPPMRRGRLGKKE